MHGWMEESTEVEEGVEISFGRGTERKAKE